MSSACLGDEFDACPEDQRVVIDPADAQIWPPRVYTGYNGRDLFLAPISVNFMADEWRTTNSNVAQVAPLPLCGSPSILEPSSIVTSDGPGTTQVIATAPGIDLRVDVIVTQYSIQQTDAGAERYNNSEDGNNARRSCASCHQQADGVDHTPLEMAYHPDASILEVSMYGKYPDICTDATGAECACGSAGCDNVSPGYTLNVPHTWDLTPAEQDGIVAYMRSLRPRGL